MEQTKPITPVFDQMRDAASSGPSSALPSPERADPAALAAAGITTRESLSWLASQTPNVPTLRYQIGDLQLREAARAQALQEHQRQLHALRARFEQSATKARQDFGLACQNRSDTPERETP